MEKTKLIVGNWKMNGESDLNKKLIEGVFAASNDSKHAIVVIPPFTYLAQVKDLIGQSNISLGAQNVSAFDNGAYTGEISASMLVDVGCEYVLIGHSERRQYFKETDDDVALKIQKVLGHQLTPILCLGETLEQREGGEWKEVIKKQIMAVVDLCNVDAFNRIIIAYEPVWAIGSGKSASAEVANEVHEFIFCTINQLNDNISSSLKILYGGSVTAANSRDYMLQEYIDGVLVGGASLKCDLFSDIIRSV